MGDHRKVTLPTRPERKYISEDFVLKAWEDIESLFKELEDRSIESGEELRKWFKDRSELESAIAEDIGWRYIRMTCYTDNEEYSNHYKDFVENISPKIAPVSNALNNKAMSSPFIDQLAKEEGYDILIREMKKDIELFREENIPLFTKLQTESQKYGQITGAMTVEVDGQEMTLQQAAVLLQSTDRTKRKEVYASIAARRLKDKETLDSLFSEMIKLRHQVGENAGFKNFRDYMFKSMGRFDY
ncbi:MAG: M3 family oligoendopeptidase, partial [Cyclobacteriaceae bacterium]|nr:M3 family oligoendopeptidase [Cyclobacteriaceae bacterium]